MPKYYPPFPFPSFATDELYPAGSDPWSAGPTKVEPSSGEQAAGVQPNDQIDAQVYNWLNHRYSQLLQTLAHHPLQNWHAHTIVSEDIVDSNDVGPSGYTVGSPTQVGVQIIPMRVFIGTGGSTLPDFVPQQPLIGAFSINVGTGILSQRISGLGLHWHSLPNVTGLTALLTDVISPFAGPLGSANNVVMWSELDTYFVSRSVNGGTSYPFTVVVGDPTASPVQYIKFFHQAANGRIFAALAGGVTDGARVSVSDTEGQTWTRKNIGSSTYTITSIADDGGDVSTAIIVATVARSAASGPAIIRSIDNGETWDVVLELSDSIMVDFSVGYVAYSPIWKQFLIVRPGLGEVYTSANGAGWTRRIGLPRAAAGITYDPECVHALACIGPVFAMLANMSGGPIDIDQVPGVFYTLDCGTKWHFVAFGALKQGVHDKRLTGIRAWGGRFLCSSRGVAYFSDPVWAPDPDLTTAAP